MKRGVDGVMRYGGDNAGLAPTPQLSVVPDPSPYGYDPDTGHIRCQHCADNEDLVEGFKRTVEKQSREIGTLTRKLRDEDDPAAHPLGRDIVKLIERWRDLCHPKATVGKARVKLVKARLADGFALDSEDWLPDHPTLTLAIDGVASHPYLLYGKRKREGSKANCYNDLKDALGDEPKVEESARAGYAARRDGWTLEGWPNAS